MPRTRTSTSRAVNLSSAASASAAYRRSWARARSRSTSLPEQGRRNVNTLTDEDWEEILDQAGVPQEMWAELIDCFHDWTDEDDEHHLNGAESDDSFYEERGYKCKNAPLDTVDELLLIKGFTPAIVYGGPPEDRARTVQRHRASC